MTADEENRKESSIESEGFEIESVEEESDGEEEEEEEQQQQSIKFVTSSSLDCLTKYH